MLVALTPEQNMRPAFYRAEQKTASGIFSATARLAPVNFAASRCPCSRFAEFLDLLAMVAFFCFSAVREKRSLGYASTWRVGNELTTHRSSNQAESGAAPLGDLIILGLSLCLVLRRPGKSTPMKYDRSRATNFTRSRSPRRIKRPAGNCRHHSRAFPITTTVPRFNAPNTSLAGPSGTDGIPVGRGSDAVRAAALARYSSLPAAQKALLLKTFLDPANDIYSEHSGKASEYETAIGFYQKRDGTTYFEDSGVQSESHDVDDMFASVGIGSLDARRTLAWVVDFHSHSNDRSPGLSGPDSTAYNNGYGLIFGTDKVRLPMAYSGAFYAKQQVFYGWTRTENYTLTFGEMRNVLSH
ncbi:MAG: hypothetical protein ABI273_09580 [Lacunisphaera sp.]